MSLAETPFNATGLDRQAFARLADDVDREYGSLFALYRRLHAEPEISGQELETSRRIAGELETLGFRVIRGVGGHGVVGLYGNGEGPTIMVRADLDALPIREETDLPYASRAMAKDPDGGETAVMHACGHDIHMTVLVGTARLLVGYRQHWRGTLLMVGQPAEESGAGAVAMLEDGLFERFPRPDCVLGLHVAPPMPAGTVGYSGGAAMAGCGSLDLRIRGIGGHGSRPHETIDPIVMAAETVLLLQTIVSRETDPQEMAVLSVGAIHGGSRSNIIPDEVALKINYRYFSPEVERRIVSAIERTARGVAVAAGVPENRMPILTTRMTGPPVYNDRRVAECVAATLREILGEERVVERPPWTASDDFAHFGAVEPKIPLFYFWLGVTDPRAEAAKDDSTPCPGIHNPSFAPVPEPAIKTGVQAMTCAVLRLLAKANTDR